MNKENFARSIVLGARAPNKTKLFTKEKIYNGGFMSKVRCSNKNPILYRQHRRKGFIITLQHIGLHLGQWVTCLPSVRQLHGRMKPITFYSVVVIYWAQQSHGTSYNGLVFRLLIWNMYMCKKAQSFFHFLTMLIFHMNIEQIHIHIFSFHFFCFSINSAFMPLFYLLY